MNVLILFGILVFFNSLIVTAWWVTGEHPYKVWAVILCGVAIFAGAILIFQGQNRAMVLSNKWLGTIKAAADQASTDAEAIAEIKKRIESQSATVDLVAKEATSAKELVNDLSKKNSKAEEKLSELDRSIKDGNHAVEELQLYTRFNSIVIAAQNDNRPAYDQLWKWSADRSFPFQKSAAQAAQTIMDQHNPAMTRGGFNVPWKDEVDPQKLSLPELKEALRSAPPHVRLGILEFVWEKRSDIAKRNRLQFLVDVLKNDESLQVVEYAGRYFSQGTNDRLKPLAIEAHLKWWGEHKDTIE